MNQQQEILFELGKALRTAGYSFVAPTPLTYDGYLRRTRRSDADPLVEAFGWNRPFRVGELDERYISWLESSRLLQAAGSGHFRSKVRFSTIGNLLFVHSGYPTVQESSVFFGPDTYRFAREIKHLSETTPAFSPRSIVDIGTGTGAGGIYAATMFPSADQLILADINQAALELAQVNASINDIGMQTSLSDVLNGLEGKADLIIGNPPYLIDAAQRAYRHGGGDWGCDLAVRILEAALGRLTDMGRLLLYTGTPVVAGVDKFFEAALPILSGRLKGYRYEETDPDVFGEELKNAPYDQADRIATVILNVSAADIIRY